VSVSELLSMMQDVLGLKATVRRMPSRPFDVERNVLDIGRLRSLTDLDPIGLREGLSLTVGADTGVRALS
jgi:hypothetical protein